MLWKRPNTYIKLGTFFIITVKLTWDPNVELTHGMCTRNVEILWASLFCNRIIHVQLSSFILGNDLIRTSLILTTLLLLYLLTTHLFLQLYTTATSIYYY
jgi:hypothetical protein